MEIITNQRLQKTWKMLRIALFILIILTIFFIIGVISLLTYGTVTGPPPLAVPQTTIFYAEDETIIGESHNGENRYWVPLSDIAPEVISATLSIEDRKFYDHYGFDFKRIVGAAIADIKAMAKVQGASTITQQYARNLFLEHDKTWQRKLHEALYTVRLETNYSKDEILEGYLNTIYYGHGAYGIEAAANHYFNKHAKNLTLSEAAILAGIPKAPSYYSPLLDLDKSKNRQHVVLQTMVENEFITKNQAEKALHSPLQFRNDKTLERKEIAPYFLDAVKQALKEKVKLEDRIIELGGLRVYTTLNPNLQAIAEEQVAKIIDSESTIQTSLVAMDPHSGEIKALIGGRDYSASPFNRAIQAERMPGSTFKPFLYYAAIENGFTPATMMRSEPMEFPYDEGREVYAPSNYNNYYAHDFISLAQALALSDNIYAVKTHMFLDPNTLYSVAKEKFGITSHLLSVPSLALGTSSVKMIDMVKAYSILANNGGNLEPVFIDKVVDYEGNIIYKRDDTITDEQILNQQAAFVTTHLMTGMFDSSLNDYTTVTGSSIANQLSRPYAGKSGTTKTDSWMIGFAPQLVTGVWIGYDRDQTIDIIAERTYAKRIWASFMEKSLKGEPVLGFKPAKGVIAKYINPDNGKLATESCPVKRLTYFVEGTEPTEYCTDHIEIEQIPNEKQADKKEEKGWLKKIFDWFN